MIIRDAVETDLPNILSIYNHAILTTTATFDLEKQTLEQRKEWFSHYGKKHPIIVACIDDHVAGYCSLSPYRSKAAYNRTVELSVYIDEKYRGKGIAKNLMTEIIQRAKGLGHHVIISGITKGNDASVKMHEQFGFEYIGCFREVGYKFDTWLDVLFYQLIIDT
ncbi:N-acetyltransferase family protein [Chengkuizengella sp. SCS-71B]|uniref:GNAT family N-acetyltransferase n=1 Tax=Chengkuizengella sp. SCS-71B TaxID=3115290 RepID=UPI0032C21201